MIKSKIIKGFIVGACVAMLSTGVAFANAEDGAYLSGSQPSENFLLIDREEIREKDIEGYIDVNENYRDNATSNLAPDAVRISDSRSEKQKEVDKFLFEDNIEEIRQREFQATHTSEMDGYIEIGIMPYTEENAQYLYNIFGESDIKVVEGYMAELQILSDVSNGIESEMSIVSEDVNAVSEDVDAESEDEEPNTSKNLWAYTIGGTLLVGGAFIVIKKLG